MYPSVPARPVRPNGAARQVRSEASPPATPQPMLIWSGRLLPFMTRFIVVMAAFYWVSQGDWRRVLSCLLGFLVARTAIQRLRSRPKGTIAPLLGKAAS